MFSMVETLGGSAVCATVRPGTGRLTVNGWRIKMARMTYYVVLPFVRAEDGELVAEDGQEARDGQAAVRAAARLAPNKAGVVAFSRDADPDIGDYSDAVVLARFGELPSDVAGAISG